MRLCPGLRGVMSRNPRYSLSSYTLWQGISPLTMRQKTQSLRGASSLLGKLLVVIRLLIGLLAAFRLCGWPELLAALRLAVLPGFLGWLVPLSGHPGGPPGRLLGPG